MSGVVVVTRLIRIKILVNYELIIPNRHEYFSVGICVSNEARKSYV